MPVADLPITTTHLLTGVYVAVGIMLMIALYHVILVLVDVRKVMKRVTSVSGHVEKVIDKPLRMAEQALDWISGYFDGASEEKEVRTHKKSGK